MLTRDRNAANRGASGPQAALSSADQQGGPVRQAAGRHPHQAAAAAWRSRRCIAESVVLVWYVRAQMRESALLHVQRKAAKTHSPCGLARLSSQYCEHFRATSSTGPSRPATPTTGCDWSDVAFKEWSSVASQHNALPFRRSVVGDSHTVDGHCSRACSSSLHCARGSNRKGLQPRANGFCAFVGRVGNHEPQTMRHRKAIANDGWQQTCVSKKQCQRMTQNAAFM